MLDPIARKRSAQLLAVMTCAAVHSLCFSADEPPFKLTIGNYFYDDVDSHYNGQDYNLRWRGYNTSAWVGYYQDPKFGDQLRSGADGNWQPLKSIPFYLQPSTEIASHGYLGGSFGFQVGDDWSLQAALARSNLRPFENLGFDPSEAIFVAAGHQDRRGDQFTVSMTRDDRLHTGQEDFHFVAQVSVIDDQHLKLDTLYKSGSGATGKVHGLGESMTYDFPRWFMRLAYDPKQNFGTADVTRLSGGVRF